jgi:hypothetical protein
VTRPGRRTFVVASVFLLLVGVLQAAGHSAKLPADPRLEAIEMSLRAYRYPLGLGMAPTLMAIQDALSLTVSITLVWLGLMGVLVGLSDASPQVLRRMTFANMAGCAALMALYAHYRIPPPFVSLALVEVMFALALIRQAMGMQRGTGASA